MGRMVCSSILAQDDMELVAAVDPRLAGIDFTQATGIQVTGLSISGSIENLARVRPDAVVDFSVAAGAYENLLWCAKAGIPAVIGTTGLSSSQLELIAEAFGASRTGAIIASNFSIGAVLMMRFAEVAAPFFDTAEIVEMHHARKVDAPSGTSLATAERIRKGKAASSPGVFRADPTERFVIEGARGSDVGDGIRIHSLRTEGAVAHQEVIFGVLGQSLTIRHDSYDRSSFMPGVLMALRAVTGISEFVEGIDWIIDAQIDAARGEGRSM